MLNYNEFLLETYGQVTLEHSQKRFLLALSEQTLQLEEQVLFKWILEEGGAPAILEVISNNNWEAYVLQESIMDKVKQRVEAAKEQIKDKGKKALDSMSDGTKMLLKVGGNILKPLGAVIQKIGEAVQKAWEKGKAMAQAAIEKATEKIQEKVKNLIKDGEKKKALTEELGNLTKMAADGAKFLTGGFTNSMASAGQKAATSNESYMHFFASAVYEQVAYSLERGMPVKELVETLSAIRVEEITALLEGGGHEEGGLHIPFLSTLINKIGHMPPFSYFHDLGHKAEKATNNALERASYIISKVGGAGPYEFALIGALVGVAVGYYTEVGGKTALKAVLHGVEHALGVTIPGLGIVFSIIKYTGLALAIHGVIKAVVGQGEKEGEEEQKTDQEGEKETTTA